MPPGLGGCFGGGASRACMPLFTACLMGAHPARPPCQAGALTFSPRLPWPLKAVQQPPHNKQIATHLAHAPAGRPILSAKHASRRATAAAAADQATPAHPRWLRQVPHRPPPAQGRPDPRAPQPLVQQRRRPERPRSARQRWRRRRRRQRPAVGPRVTGTPLQAAGGRAAAACVSRCRMRRLGATAAAAGAWDTPVKEGAAAAVAAQLGAAGGREAAAAAAGRVVVV